METTLIRRGAKLAVSFEKSVFLNCPFDDDYAPMLQAIAFCIAYMGFTPRMGSENADNAAARLARIEEIVNTSMFGIHDLSRCVADNIGDYSRMNMPFELGIDYGCRQFGSKQQQQKSILVLEQNKRDYLRSLSDISGWDILTHGGDHIQAVRCVRNWLLDKPSANRVGASEIQAKYATFQEWHLERELLIGASVDDVRDYPTPQIIRAMLDWIDAGQPT